MIGSHDRKVNDVFPDLISSLHSDRGAVCRPVVQRAVGSLINGSLLPTAAAAAAVYFAGPN